MVPKFYAFIKNSGNLYDKFFIIVVFTYHKFYAYGRPIASFKFYFLKNLKIFKNYP